MPYDARPLMYRGTSDRFLAPTQDVPLPSADDGIEFEGEFGWIQAKPARGVAPIAVTPDELGDDR